MRGKIVSYFPPERCFVVKPEYSTACDVFLSEDDLPIGSVNLDIEFDIIQSHNGFRATNARVVE